MRSVYLSPHLDDAVLSCGGRITLGASLDERQQVVTFFSGVPSSPKEAAYVHLRRAEDRAALAYLGLTDVVQLDFLDGIYRTNPAGQSLYAPNAMCGALNPVDRALVGSLVQQVVSLVPSAKGVVLYAPMAVGRHVDHQLIHRVGLKLAAKGYPVHYYEDLPYAFNPRALAAAFAGKVGWNGEALALDEHALAQKVRSMQYYRSQLAALFGDELQMSEALRAYAAKVAGKTEHYAERVWYP